MRIGQIRRAEVDVSGGSKNKALHTGSSACLNDRNLSPTEYQISRNGQEIKRVSGSD